MKKVIKIIFGLVLTSVLTIFWGTSRVEACACCNLVTNAASSLMITKWPPKKVFQSVKNYEEGALVLQADSSASSGPIWITDHKNTVDFSRSSRRVSLKVIKVDQNQFLMKITGKGISGETTLTLRLSGEGRRLVSDSGDDLGGQYSADVFKGRADIQGPLANFLAMQEKIPAELLLDSSRWSNACGESDGGPISWRIRFEADVWLSTGADPISIQQAKKQKVIFWGAGGVKGYSEEYHKN